MPYVELNTNTTIADKETICREITEKIVAIEGKKPEKTMVKVSDDQFMYFDLSTEKCARVKIDLFRPSSFEDKTEYFKEISELLTSSLGIPANRIYLSFAEYPEWGSNNNYRK